MLRIESRMCVTGRDAGDYVEYFGTVPANAERPVAFEYVITRPRENWDYDKFRLFVRPLTHDDFTPRKINRVVRFRDGGTTEIETEIGDFLFPTPFDPDGRARFNGDEIGVYPRVE